MPKLCKIGIHKWGKKKQWLTSKGAVVVTERCENCGKLKGVDDDNADRQ